MKITAIIGSGQKRGTWKAVQQIEKNLTSMGDVEFSTVFLNDYQLGMCKGCKQCFDSGECKCPLQDDRDALIKQLEEADGIIIAYPVYAFHVPAAVKNMLDRLAFYLHRPHFFAKKLMPIAAQAFLGGASANRYVSKVFRNMGFDTVKGCIVNTLIPTTEKVQRKNAKIIEKAAKRFNHSLKSHKEYPSLYSVCVFRAARTNIKQLSNDSLYDYQYYSKMGWLESDYYTQTALRPIQKALGRIVDWVMMKALRTQ